jgi:hypothetical protein
LARQGFSGAQTRGHRVTLTTVRSSRQIFVCGKRVTCAPHRLSLMIVTLHNASVEASVCLEIPSRPSDEQASRAAYSEMQPLDQASGYLFSLASASRAFPTPLIYKPGLDRACTTPCLSFSFAPPAFPRRSVAFSETAPRGCPDSVVCADTVCSHTIKFCAPQLCPNVHPCDTL